MLPKKTLKPGQKGTKGMLKRYGPSLLNVRYRYDEARREHVKTVEIVVQRRSREGEAECSGTRASGARASGTQVAGGRSARSGAGTPRRVALRIGRRERVLQQRVKSAGGRWDPVRRVWFLRRDEAERLDLLPRVVGGGR
ncbi:MAG: hypothetical protein GY722_18580 [bacterium]|nr:hypothetical protein [bacterium]